MHNERKKGIRVLIVDSYALVRAGLRMLVENHQEMDVVGEADSGGEALAIAAREQPDIILFDIELKEDNGLDYLNDLSEVARDSRVLVVTGLDNESAHRRAVHLGAMGIVLKDQPGETLIKAIEKVHAGEVWLDRAMMARVLSNREKQNNEAEDFEASKIASLTDREREVVKLICEGLKTKQIAERLFISEKTVSNHLASIYDKLGVSDRLDLAIYAYRQRMIRLPHQKPDVLNSLR